MAQTMIMNCKCKSKFQDKRYGEGKRLHNLCEKGARCTVCNEKKSFT